MTVTAETFRQRFRALNDPSVSPEDTVNFYIALATQTFTGGSQPTRFDPVTLDQAIGLFVAHHLVLDKRDLDTQAAGGVPGGVQGVATGKTVDKVSVSFDTKAVTFDNEPFWNQTRYGVQLMNLVYMFGAGGVQLGTPQACEGNLFGWGSIDV